MAVRRRAAPSKGATQRAASKSAAGPTSESAAMQRPSASGTGTATGSMFKARMQVAEDQAGSKVELVVDLPMALTLMKGMIEKKLRAKVDEVLA